MNRNIPTPPTFINYLTVKYYFILFTALFLKKAWIKTFFCSYLFFLFLLVSTIEILIPPFVIRNIPELSTCINVISVTEIFVRHCSRSFGFYLKKKLFWFFLHFDESDKIWRFPIFVKSIFQRCYIFSKQQFVLLDQLLKISVFCSQTGNMVVIVLFKQIYNWKHVKDFATNIACISRLLEIFLKKFFIDTIFLLLIIKQVFCLICFSWYSFYKPVNKEILKIVFIITFLLGYVDFISSRL